MLMFYIRGRDPKAVDLSHLRALRLWHWTEVIRLRRIDRRSGATDHSGADFHLKAVQTLNDLFPFGDTAENDYVVENQKVWKEPL